MKNRGETEKRRAQERRKKRKEQRGKMGQKVEGEEWRKKRRVTLITQNALKLKIHVYEVICSKAKFLN